MAFKKQSAAYPPDKAYLWRMAELGNGMSMFGYVTADAVAAVAMSGYFTAGGDTELTGESAGGEGGAGSQGTEKRGIMKPGDLVYVFQVAAIDDARTIQQDIAAGLVDVSLHAVVNAAAGVVDLSEDLLGATVTYTS